MQGDLISKQSVIEKMWELYNSYGNDAEVYDELTTEAINREFSRLQRAIEGMETAYDVEKVIEHTHKIFVDELEIIEKGIPEGGEYTEEAYRMLYLNKKISDAVRNGGKE